jgi:hypothetical protein
MPRFCGSSPRVKAGAISTCRRSLSKLKAGKYDFTFSVRSFDFLKIDKHAHCWPFAVGPDFVFVAHLPNPLSEPQSLA